MTLHDLLVGVGYVLVGWAVLVALVIVVLAMPALVWARRDRRARDERRRRRLQDAALRELCESTWPIRPSGSRKF